jgi:hypothetical protein
MDRVRHLREGVYRDFADRMGEISQISIQTLVDLTENAEAIDTGAYIASHHIETPEGDVFFEGIDRPDPNEEFQRGVRIFDPPDVGSVREDVSNNWEGEDLVVTNGRFYEQEVADNHEIYDIASEIVQVESGRVARRPSTEPVFRATRQR